MRLSVKWDGSQDAAMGYEALNDEAAMLMDTWGPCVVDLARDSRSKGLAVDEIEASTLDSLVVTPLHPANP